MPEHRGRDFTSQHAEDGLAEISVIKTLTETKIYGVQLAQVSYDVIASQVDDLVGREIGTGRQKLDLHF